MFAISTMGQRALSMSFMMAERPPVSAVPVMPSSSSNNIMWGLPKRLVELAAGPTRRSICSAVLKSLAFVSISSKPRSFARAWTATVLPVPGGP